MISIQRSPASSALYNGKRAQGKRHMLVLAQDKSTFSGPCSATTRPTKNKDNYASSPLGKRIENAAASVVNFSAVGFGTLPHVIAADIHT